MAPALAAGLIVAAVHAPFGIEVLRRGIVFIDLAMAQIVGLALILLGLWLEEPSWMARQAAAFGAGVVAALFFRWIERATSAEQEAVIGGAFVVAASLVLLALTDDPHGGEEMRSVLSGQILFVSWRDIAMFAPIYAAAILLRLAVSGARSGMGFFVPFALVVTASVQLVGVYVVFASLILPALAARSGGDYALRRALVNGAAAVVVGIVVSTAADLPAGPVLVICFAVAAAATRAIFWRRSADA